MKKIITFEKKLEFPSMIAEVTAISLDQQLKFKDQSNIEGMLIVKGTYKRTEATRIEEDFNFELPTEIILTEKIDLDSSKIDIDDFFYEIENDDTINCHIDILVEGIEIVEVDETEEENIILDNHVRQIDEIKEELRECDGDYLFEKQEEENIIEEKIEIKEVQEETKEEKNIEEKEEQVMKEEINIETNNKIEETKMEDTKTKIEQETTKETEENIEVGSLFTSLKDSEETFSTYSVYIVREEETVEKIMEKYKVTKEQLESYNDISSITKGSKVIIPVENDTN